MIERCFIDNIDIYERFGVVIKSGGYKDLLTFPALKDPEANDWPEEDGVEVDLDLPVLQIKTVTIPFMATKPTVDANEFISFVCKPGKHTIHIPCLDKSWILRVHSQSEYTIKPQVTSFSLQFTDDQPSGARNTNYPRPEGGGIPVISSGYDIDAIPFEHYGIVVEEALNDLLKAPTIKQNLTRSFATSDGQLYDTATVVFNKKESTFKCCFVTASVNTFWDCYHAFFNDLIQPGERILYCEYTGEEYPCYYKKSSNFNIEEMDGRFVCTFNLTFEFICFRIGETEYILATEDNCHIVLEDGETRVDLRVNNF